MYLPWQYSAFLLLKDFPGYVTCTEVQNVNIWKENNVCLRLYVVCLLCHSSSRMEIRASIIYKILYEQVFSAKVYHWKVMR